MTSDVSQEIQVLRERLREAEETIAAIRNGDVDAVVVAGPSGVPQVYTLETADQTYRALVEEMQEGALTLSLDGTILYCNRRFATLVDDDFSHIVGTPLRRFIPAAEHPAFDQIASACGKGEFSIQADGSGALSPVHLSFAMLPSGNGQPDAACCVVTDLTDQKAANDALREAHQRLVAEVEERERTESMLRQSQKMEVVGQLTGGVAHDFNNLLMAVSAGLNLLDRQTDPEKVQRIRQGMRQSIERGAALTRQLLTFSRTKQLEAVPIDLSSQIAGMRELLDRSLGGNINVDTAIPADTWPVHVDIGEFELVVLNLCINARDAMPEGGTITISARNESALEDDGLAGDFVCIGIADRGIGMSPETVARAVEPFYTTKDVGKGSGLGLAQAYGFAQASGGGLRIESELGVGTTIRLLLPRSSAKPKRAGTIEAEAHAPIERAGERPFHILLVEDDEDVAAFTEEILIDLDLEVTRVATGKSALDALANGHAIDAVFSDVMMPGGMNGITLIQRIRESDPTLPVVLTSGYAAAFTEEAKGMNIKLLSKPYSAKDLRNVLAQALSSRRAD